MARAPITHFSYKLFIHKKIEQNVQKKVVYSFKIQKNHEKNL